MVICVPINLHPQNRLENCNFSNNHTLTAHREDTEVLCFIL